MKTTTLSFESNSEMLVNPEGAPTYRRSLKEQVLQVLSTNTLSDTFYVKKEQLVQETINVLLEAREKDHRFLAQAIVWARQESLMKLVPVLALALLSGKRGIDPALFRNTFQKTILTPDDLRTFVQFIKQGTIPGRNGLGGIVRDVVRDWMLGISEYHCIKYGSVRSKEITLRDIIRMTHPKATSDALNERFGWLVRGSVGSDSTLNPQIAVFEKLKSAKTEEGIVSLVRQGKLPFEVVVPTVPKMTKAVWTELLMNAPYMNLLRNLRSFRENGVFEDEANVEYAVKKLTTPEAVEKSRVLPFRFFDALKAYEHFDAQDMRIEDAIRQGLELSFVNLPNFGLDLHMTIGTDVSGSMGDPISEKGTTRHIDIAGIFTGALLKRSEKVLALPFEGHIVNLALSKHDSIAETARKIASVNGGSTAIGAPIEYLLNRKIKTDVFIGITDNIDWAYGDEYRTSASFLNLWRRYRKEINPNATAFLVTIDPSRCAVAPQGEKGVHFIYGWSEKVLNYISLKLSTGESQVESISKMKL
jgi:60 kDa SS-A/Ro ribonucleoprotein